MLKYLAVFALLLYVFLVQAHAQTNNAQQASKSQQPAPKTAPVVIQNSNSPSLQYPHQENVPKDVRVVSAPAKDRYDKAAVIANLALVLVGIGGIVVAVCTMQKIERQTKAAQDSILLQETAYEQWIDLVNWKSSIKPDYLDGWPRLNISVEVANSTKFPVTLNHAEVSFGSYPCTTVFLGSDRFLAPNVPVRIESMIDINEDKKDSFMENALGIPVTGKIIFTGVLKRQRTQEVDGVLVCSAKSTRFEPTAPMHPKPSADDTKEESI